MEKSPVKRSSSKLQIKPALHPAKKETPSQYGFSMPAEWVRHEATWLSWPHNIVTWPGKRLAEVRDIYLQMLEALLPGEKVHLLVNDAREKEEVVRFLKPKVRMTNLIIHEIPTVDAWIRDYGPTFVTRAVNNEGGPEKEKAPQAGKAYCKWIFNAWGAKYADLMQDTHIFENRDLVPSPCFPLDIVLEGGSIEVNGEGTCLTTEQCLLNKNRNPHLSRKDIEQLLKDYLGVSQIIWVKEGIVGDDTDGHIDDIVRFVDPQTIVSAFEEDERDENYEILRENWERLKNSSGPKGKKWNLVKLPMPGPIVDDGVRLPASYANFYIANSAVLLPVYRHRNDSRAAAILQEHFKSREIISIPCNALVYGLGAIHCVSQQEPV